MPVFDGAAKPAFADLESVPVPLPKPPRFLGAVSTQNAPITIFISRKTGKLYVRQNFAALFSAPVTIERPEQPLGTHVFTAMQFMDDHAALRWNVVSFPGENARQERRAERAIRGRHRRDTDIVKTSPEEAAQTPHDALARIDIPPDVLQQISELIVPGSSLIVSDQGVSQETGEGTDFIVVTR
jgi:hypothetical protein